MDILAGLNPQQQQAVSASTGPVLVMAGPGSGKTRVLTHRVAYLIGLLGVRPYHILAVTFTNRAAREMESRVVNLLGEQGRGVALGTFHAFCARLLRREAEHLPFDANFVIFDEDDQLGLLKRVLADLNLDEKRYRPQILHAAISNAKNELVLPDDYPVHNYGDELVKRVYTRYQQLLLANNAVDFDDLLLWVAKLLESEPAVREKYARRYEHVLVDEFQDTNMAQYVLLKHLASFHRNIFCVGDVDQSIYAWRGADYRNVLRFEKDYPDTQVILLEKNYRSTQSILNVAMSIIDRHPNRHPKKLFTDRGEGAKVVLHEAYDDRAEAQFVVDTISAQIARQTARPGDFAVMYRTNAQSRLIEEAFLHANLPYKLVGAQRFYGRREIKDVIAYLRLVHNPNDEFSLTRVINVPPRSIGDKTLIALRTQAQKVSASPGEFLLALGRGNTAAAQDLFSGRALAALTAFGARLSAWIALAAEASPLLIMDRILDDVDYHAYIDDGSEEGQDRWDNVMELRRLAAEYQDRPLGDFLQDVALVADQDTLDTQANVPTLLTLHAAKGLEFSRVFIVGLNDGTLPHARSFDNPEAMLEERRLLYVGITRAKDHLYLVYSQNRSAYGYTEPADPSRFLADISPDLLDEKAPRRSGRAHRTAPARWQSAPAAASLSKPQFKAGMRVHHETWGEGMVLSSRLQDNDEIVDVFFENMGLKRVLASMAKLSVK